MLHARRDYDRIQDPAGLIPEDEPIFILRARDVCTLAAMDAYCEAGVASGIDVDFLHAIQRHMGRVVDWQDEHGGTKVPDAPKGEFR